MKKKVKSKRVIEKNKSKNKVNKKKKAGISKINSPKISSSNHSITRVPTGISNFDTLVEGGFERGSTNLVVGGPGCGKTIFAIEFLVEGMKRGERCLYVSFEEKKEQFYLNSLQMGWDLAAYESQGLLFFLEYTPLKVKTMLEEGGGSIENIMISKKISRLVIDSMTAFSLLFEDELARREAAFSLFNMIRKWNCTSVLTLESEESIEKSSSGNSLMFEADGIVFLYFLRTNKKRQHYLEILKMRGTNHSEKTYPFEITGKGIIVSTRPASGIKP